MYKVLFFKFFLFVMYMTSGLISKISETKKREAINNYQTDLINNVHLAGNPSSIGIATKWVNPFVTRFKPSLKPTTTQILTTITNLDVDEYEYKRKFRKKRHIFIPKKIKSISSRKF